ncbi:DNA-directed DNA polymerase [Tanacetum coccineum]
MTHSTTKKLTKPPDEPEREFRRLRRAVWCQQQNKSLAIAGRNLFDDEASSFNNTRAKPLVPSKTLREHSLPNFAGFENPITLPAEQTGRIVNSGDILLIQGTCTFQGLKSENPIHHIKHYLSIVDNIRADGATRDTSRLRFFYFSLKGKAKEWHNKIPPTQITTWDQLVAQFLDYFFLVGRTSFLRDMILRFKQGNNESIKSAWIRFQDLVKQVPHHGIQKWLLVQIFHDNISQKDRGKLDQFAHFSFSSLTKEEGWNRIEDCVQYQDDIWDDPSPPTNTSSISGVIQPTFKGRLKRACMQISHLEAPQREIGLRNPYLICDLCGGAHEADECDQNNPTEQVCLSRGDIYDDPSLLRFYYNDDVPLWGNNQRKGVGESGPDWVVRSKFEDELAGFMLEKKFHTKGLGETLDQHRRGTHEQFSQILSEIESNKTPEPDAPNFAITTRSETSTRDPPYPTPLESTTIDHTERTVGKEGPKGEEPSIVQDGESPQSTTFYHPSKSSREARKGSLFGQNLVKSVPPFSKKLASKRGGPREFYATMSYRTLDSERCSGRFRGKHQLMPHSFFRPLGISKLKPTRMSIQLADQSIKYPIGVCENLLVKINKFIFPIDFVVLEMDKDELVPIILGRPFLATARAVIDVHEGKLCLRVKMKPSPLTLEKL